MLRVVREQADDSGDTQLGAEPVVVKQKMVQFVGEPRLGQVVGDVLEEVAVGAAVRAVRPLAIGAPRAITLDELEMGRRKAAGTCGELGSSDVVQEIVEDDPALVAAPEERAIGELAQEPSRFVRVSAP